VAAIAAEEVAGSHRVGLLEGCGRAGVA